jgi:hypothetical protein
MWWVVAAIPLLVPLVSRRSVVTSFPAIAMAGKDPYAHWSFFGLAPPPVERTVTYDELVRIIRQDRIETVQIAVQHDCIVATTTEGHRLALVLRDRDLPILFADTMERDGLPFTYLPIDRTRQTVRTTAKAVLATYGAFVAADKAGLVPWDTTPYNSLAERDAAERNRTKD